VVLVKGIAAGLILFSTGAMGLTLAGSFSQRVKNLRDLIAFVQVLESEIQFARTTLPSVIHAQTMQYSGDIGSFLHILSTRLQAGTGERFGAIWEEALGSLAANGLPKSILEDLHHLGDVLGTSDVVEQAKHLKILLHRLEQALQVAQEELEKQARLWRYLGFSAGLLIVLLLL
jgi:stage III sporulation protein AB